jgi:hypothetical protein
VLSRSALARGSQIASVIILYICVTELGLARRQRKYNWLRKSRSRSRGPWCSRPFPHLEDRSCLSPSSSFASLLEEQHAHADGDTVDAVAYRGKVAPAAAPNSKTWAEPGRRLENQYHACLHH